MKTRLVYQTVEDRNNPDDIESVGPFLCSREDSWLGHGYYFWETFIDSAHWWGRTTHHKGYVICQASYVYDDLKCLDLDIPEGLIVISDTIRQLKEKGVKGPYYIPRILEFLKKAHLFEWDAARVTPKDADMRNNTRYRSALFTGRYYVALTPLTQICFYSKHALQLSGYKIVYPDEYVKGNVV